MKAEDFLQQARDIQFAIDRLKEERDIILEDMISVKSTSDYSDRVQTSPKGDALENLVIRATEKMQHIDKRIVRKVATLTEKRCEIKGMILKMEEGQSRRILMDYYINCMSAEEITKLYRYSNERSVYVTKDRAIKDFEKIYKTCCNNVE